MRIDRIELFHVAMPLISPWRTAYGEDAEVHSVLCRMSSGSVSAWGESSPLAAPCYSPEWGGGVFAAVDQWMAPRVIGREIETGQQLQSELAIFKGNPFAKAVLDTAWWSLKSRVSGTPLHRLLGANRDIVAVGADFGVLDSIEELLEVVDRAVDEGYPRVKLKFRPGWDLPMLRAVRDRHPEQPIHIDCNSGYRLGDLELFRAIDRLQLEMIEQPLRHDDVLDHAQLQSAIETPVCLDESIVSVESARQAIQVGACKYVNVKPGRVGGLTPAVQIHDLCRDAAVPCWVGGMLESATGAAICASLAMLGQFTYPADIFPSSRFYAEDLSDDPLMLCAPAGQRVPSVAAPDVIPEPNPNRLRQLSLQQSVHE
jgi:O-succinylbenzoate synthase